jgi:hypothetical protein
VVQVDQPGGTGNGGTGNTPPVSPPQGNNGGTGTNPGTRSCRWWRWLEHVAVGLEMQLLYKVAPWWYWSWFSN